ncbi:hypothetical protein [Tabrizicola sp.]|uniref:hypothetical protein n=1 Tax=Tabrizicola sp. TaxID=2005166 RepID=UPI003F32C63D
MTGWRRALFWTILCLSLLANAVVLGLLLRLGNLRDVANGGSEGWTGVPAEARSLFRAELAENRAELLGLLTELGRARAEMFTAAAALPYDRAAVEAAQAKVRAASTALQARSQLLMLDAFDEAAKTP